MGNLEELLIELSQNCNLDCIMCGFGKRNNSRDKFMSFEDFVEIYDKLGNKADKIRLNGRGESTIHPEFKKIVNYIGNRIQMTLFTNGNYSDSEINELFIRYDIELYISMDSAKKELLENIRKGVDYDRVISNIIALATKKSRPFIVFTLQEINIDEIIPIAQFAIKNNCNLIYNVLRRDEGIEVFREIVSRQRYVISDYFKEVESLYSNTNLKVFIPDQISGVQIILKEQSITCGTMEICPKIKKELCVLYNGDITPCNMFNPYVYGNIHNESIEEILGGEKRKWFEKNHKSYYYCNNCACLVR